MAAVDSSEFKWAVLYLIGCSENPFVKAPIIPDTVLAAQAVVGLEEKQRFVTYNGTVANGVVAQYKLYMLCGPDYFTHVSNMVDLINSFYHYKRSTVGSGLARETAYAFCTAVLPPVTKEGSAIHALLRAYEIKALTRSSSEPTAIKPIRFNPHPLMEEDVVK